MADFTLKLFRRLLDVLKENGYEFQTFEKFIINNNVSAVVLRHDVDKYPLRALKMAEIEYDFGLKASYHVRADKVSNNPEIIRKVVEMGHELAYHYDDLSRMAKAYPPGDERLKSAINSFRKNLDYLRRFYPIKVISMHGDPWQSIDNRDLWHYFNYKSEGVICEVYLDIDYSSVLYLTDTGRRWNGSATNIRDKIPMDKGMVHGAEYNYRTTREIISAIKSGKIKGRIILNIHPQRWTGAPLPWLKELVWQNIKNAVKVIISASK